MALTAAQKISLFQLLELPLQKVKGFDGTYTSLPDEYATDAITQIETWIASLTADQETEVSAILAKYDSIKYNTVGINTGKVVIDFGQQRDHLKRQLLIIMPIQFEDFGGGDYLVIG